MKKLFKNRFSYGFALLLCFGLPPETAHVEVCQPAPFATDPDLAAYTFLREQGIQNAASLNGFFEKLRQVERGESRKVHIVHIGDSHLQADLLTGHARYLLQKRFGNAGRGLVFPFRVAGSTCPRDIVNSSDAQWAAKRNVFWQEPLPTGVCGFAMQVQKACFNLDISIKSDSEIAYLSDRVTVFRMKGGNEEDLQLQYLPGEQDANGPLTGTFAEISGAENPNEPFTQTVYLPKELKGFRVCTKPGNDGPGQATLHGFLLENTQQKGVLYSMIGVNGAMFMHYNKAEHFFDEFQSLEPDLIIVSLGTNESIGTFDEPSLTKEITAFMQSLANAAPGVPILMTTNPDVLKSKKYKNPNSLNVRNTLLAYANNNGLASWDLFDAMGGLGSMADWAKHGLAGIDKIHFSAEGYRAQAQMLYNALMASYGL